MKLPEMVGEAKMNKIAKLLWVQSILFLIMIPITSSQAQPRWDDREGETVLVGRISHVEGQLLRYVPEEEEWVSMVKDAPFYINDLLYSDKKGRAEFILPNNTWARIDGDTRIQLNLLKDDITEIDVTSGVVRFHNKGSYAVVKATTPFGYVMAPEETIFDLYVGDDSVEVIALKGRLDFFHGISETRFEVIADAATILADSRQVTAGKSDVDLDWNRWNQDRENLWATRNRTGGESVKYLPPRLSYEAYVLEEHGRWERVYYDGGYRYFWRPVYVNAGWAPFTVGRWTVCYGENVWIPREPFGYVTHHYGNWVLTRGYWYWAPPVARVRVRVGPPLLNIGFAWYPGRVAWIHTGVYIGWVPLAPFEPYYSYRHWGPRSVVVTNVNMINLNVNRYKYFKHAVIINKSKLYGVKNYGTVRVRNINHAPLANKYRVAPVLNHTVIKNYGNIRQRYNFTNVYERQKSNRPVIKTTRHRHLASKQGVDGQGKTARSNIADVRHGRLVKRVDPSSPRTRDRLVSRSQPDRGAAEAKFYGRERKRKASFRTEDRIENSREIQKVRRHIPVKSVRRQKARAEDQRHAIKEVKKVHRGWSPQPVRRQEVQAEHRMGAGREQTKVRRRVPRGAAEHAQPASQWQQFREGQERRKTRQNPQRQQWQPRWEKNRFNTQSR
jgi:hypothetical protein